MRLHNRLRTLERQRHAAGACPACRDRPKQVRVYACRIFIPDNGRDGPGVPPRAGERATDPGPCHTCGWQRVVEIGEVVIEQAATAEDG